MNKDKNKENVDATNLIYQTLEQQGILSTIKAQIKASVFKQIDQEESKYNQKVDSAFYWENQKCQKLSKDESGKIVLQLVKEFLEFYHLDYSLSVFQSEANVKESTNRVDLSKQLKVNSPSKDKSLLVQIIELFKFQGPSDGYQVDQLNSVPEQKQDEKQKDEKQKYNSEIKLGNVSKGSSNPVRVTQNDKVKDTFSKVDEMKKNQTKNKLDKIDKQPQTNTSKLNDKNQDQKKIASKFSTTQDKSNEKDNNEEIIIEEIKGFDDIEDEDNSDPTKKSTEKLKESSKDLRKSSNPLYTSSEDAYGASQSLGQDKSVDSLALEDYDYYENYQKQKK